MMWSDRVAGWFKHSRHSSFKHVRDSLQGVCTDQFTLTMENCSGSAGARLVVEMKSAT